MLYPRRLYIRHVRPLNIEAYRASSRTPMIEIKKEQRSFHERKPNVTWHKTERDMMRCENGC
jgi:hypothetical protein